VEFSGVAHGISKNFGMIYFLEIPFTSIEEFILKISPRFTETLLGFFIAMGMSFVMSFAMTATNIGFTDLFIFAWLRGWFIGLLVGFPATAIIVPASRRLVQRLVDTEPE